MTHYIRFPDGQTGLAALDAADLLDADGNPITASHTHALDVIGIIYIPGDELTPPVAIPGWHVNYIGELPGGWSQYVVTPEQPVRVWAS
jgi:hypothetical protein